jgi:transcription antitermination factor NusG
MIEQTDWLLLHTKAGKESFAADNLRNQRIEYFLPLTCERRPNGRTTKRVERAFFPRYLFARIPDECLLRSVRNTRGVSGIVRSGDEPLWVQDKDIEIIKNQVRGDGFYYASDRAINPEFGFAIDEIVRVIDFCSCWHEKLAKFKGPAKESGLILVEFDAPNLGKAFTVSMPLGSVIGL